MAVSYKKLFKLMIDKDMKKGELVKKSGVAYSTLLKLSNGDNVNMGVIEKICLALNCKLDDIVEIVPDIGNNITGRFDG